MQSHFEPVEEAALTRDQIDQWRVAGSGLGTRAVHCLGKAGVRTIGELRTWKDKQLMHLPGFGPNSLRNVRWFFDWTEKLAQGSGKLPNFQMLLKEFLTRREVFVIEQRFCLADPLFRPHMRRPALQEIADMLGGITRERVRQMEEAAISRLRSDLCRAVTRSQETYWINKIQAWGGVVLFTELTGWGGDPMLGGYQPWGVLLLLSEALARIQYCHEFFFSLPSEVLDQIERQIVQLLHDAGRPVGFDAILAGMSDDLLLLTNQPQRFLAVLLEHHPDICGTVDGRYFVPAVGAPLVIADIMRGRSEPVRFQDLARLYNERMQPNSRKGTRYILQVLNRMGDAQRLSPAMYQLKAATR